jgi:menaquinone-dependent protoporphyrinogen IX oxidase
MPDVLILYASKHGHTAKIARRIAETMRKSGLDPDVRGGAADTSRDFDYTDWDAVDSFAHDCAAKLGVSA